MPRAPDLHPGRALVPPAAMQEGAADARKVFGGGGQHRAVASAREASTAVTRSTCTMLLINSVLLLTYRGIPSQHTRAAANTWPSDCV